MRAAVKAEIILVFVALLWGLTFPLIKDAVLTVNPVVFVTVRFFIAALVLIPFLYRAIIKFDNTVLLCGVVIAIFNVITYIAQTYGLETVTSAQGAFITGFYVVFVPLLLPFFKMGFPKKSDISFAIIALLGIYVLTGANVHALKWGYFWVLIAAFFTAITIIYLKKYTKNISNVSALAFYQILFTGVFTGTLTTHLPYKPIMHVLPLVSVLFCAVFATSIALLLQTKYQRDTTAARAALLFALEPVFGALAGYFINGEPMTASVMMGGGLILLSIILSEYWQRLCQKKHEVSYASSRVY